MLKEKQTKTIWICNTSCPQENNTEKKKFEKKTNYRHLAFEITERRPGFKVKIVLLVTSAFGGVLKKYKRNKKICLKKMIYVKGLWQKRRKLF